MAANFAPPGRWQIDAGQPEAIVQSAVLTATPEANDLDGVSAAWKHVKAVIRDDGKSTDLYDLLQNSVRETAYAPQAAGVCQSVCSSPALAQARSKCTRPTSWVQGSDAAFAPPAEKLPVSVFG